MRPFADGLAGTYEVLVEGKHKKLRRPSKVDKSQVASTFAAAFDALLDAYQRIAEQLPLLAQFEALFEANPRMQAALATVFQDIFFFHQRALKYFKGSGKHIR